MPALSNESNSESSTWAQMQESIFGRIFKYRPKKFVEYVSTACTVSIIEVLVQEERRLFPSGYHMWSEM